MNDTITVGMATIEYVESPPRGARCQICGYAFKREHVGPAVLHRGTARTPVIYRHVQCARDDAVAVLRLEEIDPFDHPAPLDSGQTPFDISDGADVELEREPVEDYA